MVYWMPHFKAWQHRTVMAFILACCSYVLLAWYDMIYDCKDRLKPTLLGWMWGWAKPPEYGQAFDELPEKEKKIVRTVDIVVLIAVIVLLVLPFLAKN
jgi:hypothetical protein